MKKILLSILGLVMLIGGIVLLVVYVYCLLTQHRG